MTRSRLTRLAVLSLALVAVGSASRVAVADNKPVLRLHAFAVNLSGPAPARAGTLDITVDRWSTPQEAAMLRDTLAEKGADALLDALQKVKPRVGTISSTGHLGWDIRFAQETVASNGSRRIVLATDRPMSYWELANRPRSADYAFTLAEIRLTPDGKGEGKLVPAAKIDYDKETKTLEIENYSSEPVRLTQVTVDK